MDSILVDSTEEVEGQRLFSIIANKSTTVTYTKEEHGFDLVVRYKLPTLKQKDTAEMLYSKTYNRLLQDSDHLTLRELLDVAAKRKMWTEEDTQRLSEIDELIIDKKKIIAKEDVKKKKEKFIQELAALRDEKFRLAMRVGNLTATAVENLAERERTVYLLQNCVVKIDDEGNETPLYPTKQDIEDETDMQKFERIIIEGKTFWSGEGLSDFLHLGD